MSFIPTGYYEAAVEIVIPGDAGPAYVVFGGDGSVLGSASNIDLALQAVLVNVGGFISMVPSADSIGDVTVRYTTSPGVTEISESTLAAPGLAGGTPPPPQVCTLIQKVSGLAGRKNRGRMYLPAVDEGQIGTDGIYLAATLGPLQTFATQFLADLSSSSIPMAILHTSPADTPTPVSSLNVSAKVATQRRRLR